MDKPINRFTETPFFIKANDSIVNFSVVMLNQTLIKQGEYKIVGECDNQCHFVDESALRHYDDIYANKFALPFVR